MTLNNIQYHPDGSNALLMNNINQKFVFQASDLLT